MDFNRDIKPILANHCYSCHGPDEASRQGDLRLDDRNHAIASLAIVPSQASQSHLLKRIHAVDPSEVMPPPEHKRPLSDKQKDLLQKWIEQGANYAAHWAFATPSRDSYAMQQLADSHPVDFFVDRRLKELNIQPSGQADPRTLIRRVTLDLTGLPPTPSEVDQFLNDKSESAYEKVVDRLLASPSYAERMTMDWLDLARYADTNGYNNDEDRTMWPWRDWVIDAFHCNMPYDQFLIEQLAGDLIQEASQKQLIATGFLRNQGHNTEGGIIQEEYRVEYVADRVHTTATVFLGLSMQCARCHDHKYDPISQKEYYEFYALFNSLDEKQASYSKFIGAEPFVRVPSAEQDTKVKELESAIASQREALKMREQNVDVLMEQWMAQQPEGELARRFGNKLLHHLSMDDVPLSSSEATLKDAVTGTDIAKSIGAINGVAGKNGNGIELEGKSHFDLGETGAFERTNAFAIGLWVFPTSAETMSVFSRMDDQNRHRGYDLLLENGKLTSHFIHQWPENGIKVATKQPISLNEWHHIVLVYSGGSRADSIRIYVDKQLMPLDVLNDTLTESMVAKGHFHLGFRGNSLPFRGRLDDLKIIEGNVFKEQIDPWYSGQSLTGIDTLLRESTGRRTPEQSKQIHEFFVTQIDAESIEGKKALSALESELTKVKDSFAAVMVMRDVEPQRETFVLQRGQYDQPTHKVSAGIPAVLSQAGGAKMTNRLDLAKWLVDPKNPLTARVAVNRWWQHYFGVGLVKTVEDFGITGETPSHPELLDFLALKFVDSGWNVKALQKMIVMSNAYRRESNQTTESLEKDPENRWLARGPRFRLPAETVRDNALAISGLLKQQVGGPSVKPYQPEGLWEDVSVERRAKYVPDAGDGLYRRSLYTFWKRTCPPPALMSFDAPNREVCFARRPRTNTPLQSLVLMNDPTYVEAARLLGQQMIQASAASTTDRIQSGFRRAVARDATPKELSVLDKLLQQSLEQFRKQPDDARALNSIGFTRHSQELDPLEVAAWTIVGSTILNLDEVVSKR